MELFASFYFTTCLQRYVEYIYHKQEGKYDD